MEDNKNEAVTAATDGSTEVNTGTTQEASVVDGASAEQEQAKEQAPAAEQEADAAEQETEGEKADKGKQKVEGVAAAAVGGEQKEKEVYIALVAHVAQADNELTFLKDEEIVLLERLSDTKWKGEAGTGIGYFNPQQVRPRLPNERIRTTESGDLGYRTLQQNFSMMEAIEQETKVKNLHHHLIIPSKCVKFEDADGTKFSFVDLSSVPPWPLLVFANPKSGGNRGSILVKYFKRLLNPVQVFDITDGGPEKGLKAFSVFEKFRILACGGDGTASWVLSVIDRLNLHQKCSLAILPLGTGNDLARVLGWGPGYDGGNISRILSQIELAKIKFMDRWKITITMPGGTTGVKSVNNYFSIGVGAKIAHDFGEWRKKNQALFSSRAVNKAAYAFDGMRDSIARSCKNLERKISVQIDGSSTPLPVCEEIIALNIPSYGGGMDLWGTPKSNPKFSAIEMDDKKIEILTVEGSLHIGKIRVGLSKGNRLAHASDILIKNVEGTDLPIQIDGEAEIINFKEIHISHLNQASMLEFHAPPSRLKGLLQKMKTDKKSSSEPSLKKDLE